MLFLLCHHFTIIQYVGALETSAPPENGDTNLTISTPNHLNPIITITPPHHLTITPS
ncbi:MAG: hypothetical protein SOY92_08320 [Prevotella sp.]|nr:hypothetical protein [Prevotella sp.]MDY5470759.1 hypothetical protein [Prevotella sp.]